MRSAFDCQKTFAYPVRIRSHSSKSTSPRGSAAIAPAVPSKNPPRRPRSRIHPWWNSSTRTTPASNTKKWHGDSVQLPLFNQGRGSVLRAQARLGQARADLAALQIEISNEVDLARKRVLFARKLSERYRDEFIPLRERIAQRTQEQVNFMLVGQFELIRVKQLEYETYQKYLESLRDYWVARAELSRQVGARLPSESNPSDAEAVPRLPTDPGDAMQGMPGMDTTGGGEGMGSMPGMKGKHEAGMRMQSMPEAKAGSKVHNGKSMPGMPGMGTSN